MSPNEKVKKSQRMAAGYVGQRTATKTGDLKKEWQEYLEQTKKHEQIVRDLLEKMGLDPQAETPGRQVVRHIGASLVKAMEMAQQSGKPEPSFFLSARRNPKKGMIGGRKNWILS